jgi:hypothetical protein
MRALKSFRGAPFVSEGPAATQASFVANTGGSAYDVRLGAPYLAWQAASIVLARRYVCCVCS